MISSTILPKKEFILDVLAFQQFLFASEQEFNSRDLDLVSDGAKSDFLDKRKSQFFQQLDNYFVALWEHFRYFDKEDFSLHKRFCEEHLLSLLYKDVEINEYIRNQPLGYAGDFRMMNYIYDYYRDQKYLGSTLYTKLINDYTCKTEVACSNIARKDFLKRKILEVASSGPGSRILSVGSGSAREVLELIEEGRFENDIEINLIDLEENAINYVRNQLERISFDRDKIKVKFYLYDLKEIIRNKRIMTDFNGINLIYISGVFDYFSDRLIENILPSLIKIMKDEIIIFNISSEKAKYRAYYEVLGDWVMYHRTKEDMIKWGDSFRNSLDLKIVDFDACKSYWILSLQRKCEY